MSLSTPTANLFAKARGEGLRTAAKPVGELFGPAGEGRLQVGAAVGAFEVAVAQARGANRTALDLLEAVEDDVDLFS